MSSGRDALAVSLLKGVVSALVLASGFRAVSDDAALMAGPNHGSRARGSRFLNVFNNSARAVSNQSSS